MGGDSRRNIAGEVLVDGRRRVGWQQGGNRAMRTIPRWKSRRGDTLISAFSS
jgi:hypothetical protein